VRFHSFIAAVLAQVLPSGCNRQAADPAVAAKQLYAARCALCHGATGAGDGPAAPGLSPKPRDFRAAEWQHKTSDQRIEKVIAAGGAAVGLTPMMPPNPDLASDPATLAALRQYIRGFSAR
jgi:mono/diheme cytochrome c family protein